MSAAGSWKTSTAAHYCDCFQAQVAAVKPTGVIPCSSPSQYPGHSGSTRLAHERQLPAAIATAVRITNAPWFKKIEDF